MAEVIPHWLTKQASLAPNKIAIEDGGSASLTFLELKIASKAFAKKLVTKGVSEGDHIGIYAGNYIPSIIMVHALSYLGAVTVMLNTRLTKHELTYQIDDANISLILISDDLATTMKEMNFHVQVSTFSEINANKEKLVTLKAELQLDQAFTIMYTSGTTGPPKAVIHTYGNHWWSAVGSALNLGLHAEDKWLAVLPVFHIGGLSIFIKSVIYSMPVILLEKFTAETVNQAIMERKVTIVSVVTVMLKKLVEDLNGVNYPTTLRCILLGGGPVPRVLLEKCKEKHIPVFQSYGMTETSSQFATLGPEEALIKLGSAGKALFPGQLRISNEGIDGIGEIFVKGPMVIEGYFNNLAATEAAFKDGWFATGDLGYLDESGFLYVVDRRTDLIISGGENVYPSEIEAVLARVDGVLEVGVVGKPDDIWGQIPVAYIVIHKEATVTKEVIISYATEYLATYKVPKEVSFVSSLPRNAANKLIRKKLLTYHEEK